jgi:alginate O-acetyltransferase complex protein AlgI
MDQVWHYTAGMFSFRSGETLFVNQAVWMTMIFAAVFAILAYSPRLEQWQVKLYGKKQSFINLIFMSLAAIVLFIISLSAITSSGFNPFIYFRF